MCRKKIYFLIKEYVENKQITESHEQVFFYIYKNNLKGFNIKCVLYKSLAYVLHCNRLPLTLYVFTFFCKEKDLGIIGSKQRSVFLRIIT